jgi:hypothetical protein
LKKGDLGGFWRILGDLKINNRHKIMANALTNQFNRHAALATSLKHLPKLRGSLVGQAHPLAAHQRFASGILAV